MFEILLSHCLFVFSTHESAVYFCTRSISCVHLWLGVFGTKVSGRIAVVAMQMCCWAERRSHTRECSATVFFLLIIKVKIKPNGLYFIQVLRYDQDGRNS